jgi:predicted transglutaminase-like cysteine proteinase
MRKAALIGFGLVLSAISGAFAQSSIPMATAALVTKETLPPIGWVQFCGQNSAECNVPTVSAKPVQMNDRHWKQLVRINREVNDSVEPVTDLEQWGTMENWSYPTTGKGDCEDYVLEKRKRLVEAGWPRQALLITVVRDKKGAGHAVLTVRTDRGDLVLDNQEAPVKAWTETGYTFIKRQSEQNPNKWVSLGGVANSPFTATR